MVAVGCFSVRLVEAQTKTPFVEHFGGPNNQYYAEVEPGSEYFIQVQVLFGETKDKEYNVKYFVDGQDLGFYTQLCENDGHHWVGLCSRENGQTTKTAIRCVSPKLNSSNNNAASTGSHHPLAPPAAMMGRVTVKFSEAIPTGRAKKKQRNYDRNQVLAESTIRIPPSTTNNGSQKKKLLRSSEGTSTVTSSETGRLTFKAGALLQEINVHYCTALGLIHAGVLEKPPLWDLHHRSTKREVKDEPDVPQSSVRYSAKRCKVDAVFDGDNTMLSRAKEYDVIEFLDSDDDNEYDKKPNDGNDGSIARGAVVKREEENEVGPHTPHRGTAVKSEEPDYHGSTAEELAPTTVTPS